MIHQPKYRICRRLGPGVYEKCQDPKFTASQERRGTTKGKRRKSSSDYGLQLIEKQKVRFTYGIAEKQFSNYAKTAAAGHGTDKAQHLYEALEARLDNLVYRLGFVPTRLAARQLVSHGHVSVNGVRVTAPSFHVKKGDKIALRDRSKAKPFYQKISERVAHAKVPSWVQLDPEHVVATVVAMPELKKEAPAWNLVSIIEFYGV